MPNQALAFVSTSGFPTEVKISCQQFSTLVPVGCHQKQHLHAEEYVITFNLN